MKTRIIVDSTADMRTGLRERLRVVPLTVHFGEEEYVDGVSITHRAFYEKLIESDVLPRTSQAAPEAFAQEYRRAAEAGEEALVITIASKLSGTWQSACIAAQDAPCPVHVVDGATAAIGTGILAEYALSLVEGGMGAAEAAARLEAQKDQVCLIAMLDTLEYLKRGGRISKSAAFAGGLLSIKPVIALRGGEIVMLGKARGSRQSNNLLVSEIQKAGGVDFTRPVLLGYTGLSDVVLQKYIEDSSALWEGNAQALSCAMIGSVIGTHAGPGAIAAAFFKRP